MDFNCPLPGFFRPCEIRGWLAAICLLATTCGSVLAQELPTVEALIKQLEAGETQEKREAVRDLEVHAESAARAIKSLIKASDSRDEQVCLGAMRAIAAIGPQAHEAVPALIEQLSSNNEQRRYRAGVAIGKIAHAEQVDLLRKPLESERDRERHGACIAVGWLGDRGTDLLPLVAQRLGDESDEVVAAAEEALRQQGPRAVRAILEAAQHHEGSTWQQRCLSTLASIGNGASQGESFARQQLQSKAAQVRGDAIHTLCRIVPEATDLHEVVAAGLKDDAAEVRNAALEAVIRSPKLGRPSLDAIIAQLDGEQRTAELAAIAIGRLGNDALPALPVLIDRLSDDDQPMIRASISRIGPVAIPPLVAAVQGDSPRLSLAQTSEIVGAMGPQAFSALTKLCDSESPLDRAVVFRTLGRIGRTSDALVLLERGLEDEHPQVRAASANGLGALGNAARDQLDRLIKLSSDLDATVRMESLAALPKLGVADHVFQDALIAALDDESLQVRTQAARSVAALDEIPEQAIAPLLDRLKDESGDVREAAAQALSKADELPENVVASLLDALVSADASLAQAIVSALGRLEKPTEQAVDALANATEHESHDVQLAAFQALAEHEEQVLRVSDRVKQRLGDDSPEIRLAALRTLVRMASSTPERLEILADGLNDSDWVVRREVCYDLGEMERRAKPIVPQLLKILHYGEKDTDREAASSALRRIDAAPGEAVPILAEILEDEDSDRRERYYALNLLRKVGPEAKTALPLLERLRDESEGRIRDYIERTIKDINKE